MRFETGHQDLFLEKQRTPLRELIRIQNLGVQYTIGSKREDLKSLALAFLQRKGGKKRFWALNDISFTGYAGEVVGIIGHNGAGKTTLCRVMAGLLKPDRGDVAVKGAASALLSLGTGFNTTLSGRENIFLNGMMLGLSKGHLIRRFEDIVSFSELGRFIDQPLKYYSSGMRARLGFSIAAMIEPDILILDEALSTGDIRFSEKAGNKLQDLIGRSKIVVVVTHKLGFVKNFCSRALWIDRGNIKADGKPAEIIEAYEAAYRQFRKKAAEATYQKTAPQRPGDAVVRAENLGVRFLLSFDKAVKNGIGVLRKYKGLKQKQVLWALKGIDFRVKQGEIVGIIGPNGAGKTTLCRLISGLLKPDKGNISVYGKVTALLTFGAGFDIELSGRDNIYLNGMMLGFSWKEMDRLQDDIVDFAEMEKDIHRPVKHYSAGMRARLGFSIASMLKPDVFIIDEALSAGDITFHEKSSAKIQELITDAKATIVVSHNMAFIEKVCTRVLLLSEGELLYDGDPLHAVKTYQNLAGALSGISRPAGRI